MRIQSYAGWMMGALLAFNSVPMTATAAVSAVDAAFVKKAAQAGMAEVLLAQLALQKSTNPQVVAFARRMNTDHGKANAQLTAIIQQKAMTPPSSVGAKNQALMQQLKGESGSTFNNAYLKSQLPAHRQVLALFKHEAATGQDPDLVAFAKQTIPTIEEHISMDEREITKLDSGGSMSMK